MGFGLTTMNIPFPPVVVALFLLSILLLLLKILVQYGCRPCVYFALQLLACFHSGRAVIKGPKGDREEVYAIGSQKDCSLIYCGELLVVAIRSLPEFSE